MLELYLTDLEVELAVGLLENEVDYWFDNMDSEDDRRRATVTCTLLNKLKGMDEEKAELEARRSVDAHRDEIDAPGGL